MAEPSSELRPYLTAPPVGSGQRVGLFGGSFNPPHLGHVHVSDLALQRLNLDWIWWLVTPGNPLKDTSDLPPLIDRIRLCEDLTSDPRIRITAYEAALGARYTADTLRQIVSRHPRQNFVWLMGADNLGQFHKWDRWRTIAQTMPIAVIDRPGSTMQLHAAPAAQALSHNRLDENDAAKLADQRPPAWVFIHGPRSNLSSTALRNTQRQNSQ